MGVNREYLYLLLFMDSIFNIRTFAKKSEGIFHKITTFSTIKTKKGGVVLWKENL